MLPEKLDKDTYKLEEELRTAASFESFASEMDDTFLSAEVGRDLTALIKRFKIKKTKLCLEANIHENYCYQIMSGKRYPSREVLLSIFLALHLPYEEANEFLRNHGYPPLYVRRKFDAAVIYALMHGWTVLQCNEHLLANGLPLLKKETV